jgi:hypothetical protein
VDRSFTDLFSNKLFVSGLETPEALAFVRRRYLDKGKLLHRDQRALELEARVAVDLIHEVCHLWCFDSLVGRAIAVIDLRERAMAHGVPSRAGVLPGDYARLALARAFMGSMSEGLSLFIEFDVWRSENYGATRTPIAALDMLFSDHPNPIARDLLGEFELRKLRRGEVIRRKMNWFLKRFEVDEGYVPGYMAVKNLVLAMMLAFPSVKQETVLSYFKEYFWNDPVLARLILAGKDTKPEPTPLTEEELAVMSVRSDNGDPDGKRATPVRREFFRRDVGSRDLDLAHIMDRLKQRVMSLVADPALGGKLGAVQARGEHGVTVPATWEIGVTEVDYERYEAAEIELCSYVHSMLTREQTRNSGMSTSLGVPFVLGFTNFRRFSPLMGFGIKVEDGPEPRILCAAKSSRNKGFAIPRHVFPELSEGTYDYFFLIDSQTLEFEEVVFDQADGRLAFPPRAGGVVEAQLGSDLGVDTRWVFELQGYLGMITPDFEDTGNMFKDELSGVFDTIREAALDFYLEIATVRVPPQEKGAARAALKAAGPKVYLPRKSRYVELAARMSLLGNAANSVEQFALYLYEQGDWGEQGYFGGSDMDCERLQNDMAVLFAADPHGVVWYRVGDAIIWSL